MSDFFKSPGIESNSSLSGQQQSLLGPLANFASGQLGQPQPGNAQLQSQLLSSGSKQSQQMASDIYNKAFLQPQLQAFNQFTAPAIKSRFAGIGGSLSSRSNDTLAQTLQGVQATAGGQLAQMLPQIMGFPLQQTLGQIQGLGSLQEQQWNPFNFASRFATAGTVQNQNQPGGPGWGLLGSGIGAAGFLAGLSGGSPGGADPFGQSLSTNTGFISQLQAVPGFN